MKRLRRLLSRPAARLVCVCVFVIVVLPLVLVASYSRADSHASATSIPASQAASIVTSGQARSIEVDSDRAYLTATDGAEYVFVKDQASVPQMLTSLGVGSAQLAAVSYSVDAAPPVGLGELFPLLMTLLVIGVLAFSMRLRGPGLAFSRSRARRAQGEQQSVTFDDVAGATEAKEELQEIVEFLKAPEKFAAMGARIPKGVLLVGPPGTGKTLISRAVAGEAGVPFFSVSGSEFVEMFVGVGASRVRDLFEQAKRQGPSIIFIDEIDAVGRRRSHGQASGGHDEREQTLNQILVEMDGFAQVQDNKHVIVLAATNRPDVLDPALLRPGRFDRQVTLGNPDVKERTAILNVHARGKPIDARVELETLARSTPGFSGADLANLVNEAAILAVRRSQPSIRMLELQEAIDRVIGGPQKKARVMSVAEQRRTAFHEGGHAVVGRFSEYHDPVQKVTIVSRGRMGGYTRFLPEEDRHYMTRAEFEAMIASALGGWVAERLVFGEVSTGASNDIEKATNIARSMVTTYGMSASLGPLALAGADGGAADGRVYSERVAEAIDAEVRALIDAGIGQAEQILRRHRDVLDLLAARLLEEETIEGDDLEQIFRSGVAAGEAGLGTVTPLPRYRLRSSGPNLLPLPSVAAVAAAATHDAYPQDKA